MECLLTVPTALVVSIVPARAHFALKKFAARSLGLLIIGEAR